MLIDASDISTIPAEIEHKILGRVMSLSPNIISKIKACQIQYNHDVTCAIEDYMGPSIECGFYEELISSNFPLKKSFDPLEKQGKIRHLFNILTTK